MPDVAGPETGLGTQRGPGGHLPDLGPHGEGWVVIQVVLIGLAFLAGLVGPAWSGGWRSAGLIVGGALVVLGLLTLLLGLLQLRENLTPMPRPVEGGRLIDTGVYGLVRHPIYTGGVTGVLGWALGTASPAALGVAGLLFVFFDLKSRREEAWLMEAYPGYAAYRRRVRKLVPFVY